jgi:hypothetical protein
MDTDAMCDGQAVSVQFDHSDSEDEADHLYTETCDSEDACMGEKLQAVTLQDSENVIENKLSCGTLHPRDINANWLQRQLADGVHIFNFLSLT